MFLRQNHVPVKEVALLGKGSFATIIVRADAGINSLADLKGKKIGVVAFTESSYYAFQAVLAHYKFSKQDVEVQALGRAGMLDLTAAGKTHGLVNVPDNAVDLEQRGVAVKTFPIDQVFPAMAIGIVASETTIAKRPQMIRTFIKVMMRSLQYTIDDPDQAAKDYVASMPMHAGKEAYFAEVLKLYNKNVYRPDEPGVMGAFNRDRVAEVEKFYLDNGIIRTAVPLDEVFTNEFVE
jgi:NitT/TauT family transport system substrate-binding protein